LGNNANELSEEEWRQFETSCHLSQSIRCNSLRNMGSLDTGDSKKLEAIFDQNIAEKWHEAKQTDDKEKIQQAKDEYNLPDFKQVY
jgi:hypothetical protein